MVINGFLGPNVETPYEPDVFNLNLSASMCDLELKNNLQLLGLKNKP